MVFDYRCTLIDKSLGTVAGDKVQCVIYFQISKSGELLSATVETPSIMPLLDSSALRAVRASAPFPVLPNTFTEGRLGVHFTFYLSN